MKKHLYRYKYINNVTDVQQFLGALPRSVTHLVWFLMKFGVSCGNFKGGRCTISANNKQCIPSYLSSEKSAMLNFLTHRALLELFFFAQGSIGDTTDNQATGLHFVYTG